MLNKKCVIKDWAGNIKFNGKTFKDFDDASEYLDIQIKEIYVNELKGLDENDYDSMYNEIRGEYYIDE